MTRLTSSVPSKWLLVGIAATFISQTACVRSGAPEPAAGQEASIVCIGYTIASSYHMLGRTISAIPF